MYLYVVPNNDKLYFTMHYSNILISITIFYILYSNVSSMSHKLIQYVQFMKYENRNIRMTFLSNDIVIEFTQI